MNPIYFIVAVTFLSSARRLTFLLIVSKISWMDLSHRFMQTFMVPKWLLSYSVVTLGRTGGMITATNNSVYIRQMSALFR